jgi:hypothetical protein
MATYVVISLLRRPIPLLSDGYQNCIKITDSIMYDTAL